VSEFDADLLDDAQRLTAADRNGLLWALATSGAAVRRSRNWRQDTDLSSIHSDEAPRSLLLATDAPLSDAARLVATAGTARTPSIVWDEAELPVWAGPADSLIVATVHGLSARLAELVDAARRRGLAVLTVAPTGTPVADAAANQPLCEIDPELHPFAATWHALAPMLVGAQEMGALAAIDLNELADALDVVSERSGPAEDSYANPAKALALQLSETYPVVVGCGTLPSVAAQTAAHSLQRLAGVRSAWAALPNGADRVAALLGTATVADPDEDFFRDRLQEPAARPQLVVIGAEASSHSDSVATLFAPAGGGEGIERVAALDALRQLQGMAEAANVRTWLVEVAEGSPIARFAGATHLVDFAAAYCSLARGVNTRHVLGVL